MNMFKKAIVGAITLLVFLPGIAFANTIIGHLSNVSGDVMIERNGQFFRAATNSAIQEGDRIVSLLGGNANVSLFTGCTSQIGQSLAVNVGSQNFCSNITKFTQLTAADSVAGSTFSTLSVAGGTVTGGTIAGVSTGLAALGGAAAIGGIIVVAADKDSSP